jgi:hypothetical protein
MYMRSTWVLASLVVCGCSSDTINSGGKLGGSLTVTGTVLDFETMQPIAGDPMIETSGLNPPPQITTNGAQFTLTDIPEISAFQVLATLSPMYRPTYSPTILAVKSNVTGAKAWAVSETFLGTLATGFGVTPSSTKGILLVHLVGPDGTPKQNVAGSNLTINGANGPHFLDATLHPSTATTSSSSGWAVFFDGPAGTATLGQAATATVTMAMDSEPIDAGAVTLADITVTDGAPSALPTNVSFANQIVPIFNTRGCVACHSGNGPGKDLGGLQLDGGIPKVYSELTGENPLRVQTAMPEKSLVLTMPSAENPPDGHPNVTFTSPADPDYQKLLVWIREGAKNN